jgi:hypothetical protein
MTYTFEYSIDCPVTKDFAWQFWTNVDNWARVDPVVEAVEIDGLFAAGTNGVTQIKGSSPVEWKLIEVKNVETATIEILAPGAAIRFHWVFRESSTSSTVITQYVTLAGERAADYLEGIKQLEQNLPAGMNRLAEAIVKATSAK